MKMNVKKALTWTPAVLVALFLILASGLPKFFLGAEFAAPFGGMSVLYGIGAVEILIGVLLLIPRTQTLGFLMSVGLLGGATATGLTLDIPGMIWWFPLALLVLLMFTAYFTLPELLDRAKGKPVPNTKSLGLRIFSWVLVVLLLAMHAMALMGKINPPVEGTPAYDMSSKLGILGLEMPLLVVEVLTLVLFLVPRTSAIGAILMIGYMGGVLATFLTHDLNAADAPVQMGRVAQAMPGFVMVAVAGIVAWIRNPELAQRLIKGKYPAK